MTFNIAVVGAGVVGCSVALHLSEKLAPRAAITVIAEQFSPNTTSDAAGAVILPFDVRTEQNGTDNENIERWTRESFKRFSELYHSEAAGIVDIQLVSGYYSKDGTLEEDDQPWWADLTPGFRRVGARERTEMNISSHFKSVYSFSTYIINGRKYLPWMMERFKQRGGSFIQKKVMDLMELRGYDVVVNCTGLGSHELVGDQSLYPVHGDAILVKAPWIKQFYLLNGKNEYVYILPRSEDVLLGGTGRKNDWSKSPDKKSVEAIMDRCSTLVPSLVHAKKLQTWAGLRPVRDTVRLERDPAITGGPGGPVVIHCYGHGGQGVLLSWGCALDVGELVSKHLTETNCIQQKL